ncbi:MAG: hypothetical protein H5U21_00405, partial [Porphyrobacter sp.]|nr:hypothetical protein [Porphyrobacter sp.]
MTGWLWSLATILGPILLMAAIVYAIIRNRSGSRAEVERAERGAVDLRKDLDR